MLGNLNYYNVFITVAKTGSISRAADKLYISQPAVSKSISNLEEQLGTTLFTRSSRGVKLTDEGRLLYEHVENAFTYIENAGLFPTIAKMTRKQAVQFMLDYIDKNGISGALRCYANAVYDHIPSIYLH